MISCVYYLLYHRATPRAEIESTDFRGSLANHGDKHPCSTLLPHAFGAGRPPPYLCAPHITRTVHGRFSCSFHHFSLSPSRRFSLCPRMQLHSPTRNCIHMSSKRTVYPGHSQASQISCLAAIPNYDLFLSASVSMPSNHLYFAPPIGFEPATSYL